MKHVAVVGFGFMGMTHVANILKNEDLKLVAIIDKDVDGIEEKLSGNAGNFSIEEIDPEQLKSINKYNDLQACLDNEHLDAVHVCVHTDLHYVMAKMLLTKGLNVFLEKPMTLDIEEGEELVQLAHEYNCIFMVGHVVRFMPPYKQLKKWIEDQTYGQLKFLSLTRFSGVPLWGQWKEKQNAFGSSGGALFDFSIHDIDFANYLFGKPDNIESKTLPGYLSNHDYMSAFWIYDQKGIRVKIEGGNIFHSAFPFQAGYQAAFENASICYSTNKPDVIQVGTHEGPTEINDLDDSDGFYNEIAYFYQCIEKGTLPEECLPESSLDTIKLCYQHIQEDKQDEY